MSTDLNYSALTGSQIAEGLTALASIFASADTQMPEILGRSHADQAVAVNVGLASAVHVRTVAARLGAKVNASLDADDNQHTSFEYGFGRTREVESWQTDTSYTHAVVIRVYAIDEVA